MDLVLILVEVTWEIFIAVVSKGSGGFGVDTVHLIASLRLATLILEVQTVNCN
jgi:hypothetical protein